MKQRAASHRFLLRADVSPGGHRDLSEARDEDGGGQSYKGDDGLLQEVHLAHQHVGSFGARRYLFHEIHVYLKKNKVTKKEQSNTATGAGTQQISEALGLGALVVSKGR